MRPALVAALLLVTATAHADKSKTTAKALSVGGAVASGTLVLAGFLTAPPGQAFSAPVVYTGLATSIVTPSLGELYAGEWFTPGMAVRIGAVGLAVYGLGKQDTVTCATATMSGQTCKQLANGGIPLLGLAAIAFVGGVWYDALDAGDAVERYNRRHTLAPAVLQTPSGAPAPGVMLGGYF